MNKTIIFSSLVGVLLFTGCTKTIYSTGAYRSYKQTYTAIAPQKVKDSKAMHRATMRPYVVMGKKYYPTTVRIGQTFDGISSWYGPNFHAKKTSNGETYNMYAMTAAHKTLPMNTMVKVYNKDNGKSTIVRINDRGPFVGTRIIDLSNTAAHKIDMVKKGTANVRLTILGFHGNIARTSSQKNEVMSVGTYYVQVGAFSKYNGAKITQRKFKNLIPDRYNVIIRKNNKDGLNRVWISGFRSEDEARNFREENGLQGAMIIAQ
jgi:rare lipoprotein A